MHIDSGNKNVLILEEAKYSINFTESGKRFVLSWHYIVSNSFLFVNAVKIYQFKARNSEIKPHPLCLCNLSKDFTLNNMKKNPNKIIWNFESFSVDYDPIETSNILNIHRFLIKET